MSRDRSLDEILGDQIRSYFSGPPKKPTRAALKEVADFQRYLDETPGVDGHAFINRNGKADCYACSVDVVGKVAHGDVVRSR